MSRAFPLPAPGLLAKLLPLLVGGLLPLVLAALIALVPLPGQVRWLEVLPVFVMLPLLGLAMAVLTLGRVVEIEAGHLQVRRWPFPRRFAVAEFDLPAARIADLDADASLRPMLKLVGTRLPGFRSGWFLTRTRQRAFVLATTGQRVAMLPLRDGRLVLLGVERPEALLAALREQPAARTLTPR